MHAGLSGTIDYREPNDPTCLTHIRDLVRSRGADLPSPGPPFQRLASVAPKRAPKSLAEFISTDRQQQYDIHDVLDCVVDGDTFREYKAEFGPSLVCGTACVGGFPVGIVANQRQRVTTSEGQYQYGGVIYVDSADKAARFVLSCNQDWIPLLFFQDVNGFMVGKESEKAGIIKAGAKLVNAVSNSRVPKITTLIGGSYGAGNYALCGKAFDPSFIFGWPTAKCAVMGGAQATSTLVDITVKSQERDGEPVDEANMEQLRTTVMGDYERQTDARYAAARGWLDALIEPSQTRNVLIHSLELVTRQAPQNSFSLGVFQV
jgi:acetyl-CoA carboxylase carboxyltransferase component